jgi:phage tail sheath gpL-like
MAINISGLPANWRAQGVVIGTQPLNGGGTNGPQPTYIIGQMLSTGTAVANIPVQVFSQSDVNTYTGIGSMLSQMYAAYTVNDPNGPVFIVPLTDNGSGTTASVSATFSGTAVNASTFNIYVNNKITTTGVSPTDSTTLMASNVAASVNSITSLGVTAVAVGSAVTFTSVHKGITAGDVQVSINKNGLANGESTPTGVTVSIGALVPGTGDPILTTALANIQNLPWTFLVCPYNTSTANTAVATLLDNVVGRWSPIQQLYGDSFSAVRGTLGTMTTFGASVNFKHLAVLPIFDAQTPVYIAAAIFAGLTATNVRTTPVTPIVGPLLGLDAPSLPNRPSRVTENALLYTGLCSTRVDNAGNVKLTRAIQTWQTDTNWLPLNTDFLLQAVNTFIKADLDSLYAAYGIVSDGNTVTAGSYVTTPSLVLQHVWGLYDELAELNIVQNPTAFKANSFVDATQISVGVLSLYLPIQIADQLVTIRILNSFSS